MIVIKFGGHAMTDEHGAFAKAIAEAISSGVTPVIVHGGGPQIAADFSHWKLPNGAQSWSSCGGALGPRLA
jgi:acetylglutamate kinase